LTDIRSCRLNEQDTVDWWDKFISTAPANRQTGSVSNDGTKLMVFGWDSEDPTGPSGNVQGIADLRSNPNVTELYGPVVVTGRTPSENLADQQTAEIKHPKSEIVRGTAHLPISSKKVKTKDVKDLHYNGFWFCIPVTELRDGDKIEFGGDGSDGYHTSASWTVKK
jgi:hypothetical protein